ncbi:hypothetical protein [uncultured Nostoc sp.]|uniref:hypothetical protein n=1 Tax=uncultured Nostoc sp. TaxID=340711 RepID=UPI0035CC0387
MSRTASEYLWRKAIIALALVEIVYSYESTANTKIEVVMHICVLGRYRQESVVYLSQVQLKMFYV